MTAHHCHAAGCTRVVPPRLLMCGKHWRMVPRHLQARVWATYVPGQEERKDPTRPYLEAARAAINAVAQKEGKPTMPGLAGLSAGTSEMVIQCLRCRAVQELATNMEAARPPQDDDLSVCFSCGHLAMFALELPDGLRELTDDERQTIAADPEAQRVLKTVHDELRQLGRMS